MLWIDGAKPGVFMSQINFGIRIDLYTRILFTALDNCRNLNHCVLGIELTLPINQLVMG